MSDNGHLGRIYILLREAENITQALGNFDAGGVISQFTVTGGPLIEVPTPEPMVGGPPSPPIATPRADAEPPPMPPPPPIPVPMRMAATVTTADMTYPPQMVEAIKQMLNARHAAVLQELGSLGITPPQETR